MTNYKKYVTCLAIVLLAATTVQASPIEIFNTGVDDAGVALADNALDTHWTVEWTGAEAIGPDPVVATSAGGFPIGPWLGDSATSAWITPSEDTEGPGDTIGARLYIYKTLFTTPGDGPVNFAGIHAADNSVVAFLVDGKPGNFTTASFAVPQPFDISVDVVGTEHSMIFLLQNGAAENPPNGPTGLRVEFTTAEFVPEPTSLALLAFGGLGLLWRRR